MRFERVSLTRWGDCDPAGIVFYPNFYRMFDENSHLLMESCGFGQRQMIELHQIVGFPLVEASAKFNHPVRWGDEMTLRSAVCAISSKTFTVVHEILVQERLCVTGSEVRIWGAKDQQSDRLRALELPQEFRLAFEQEH